MKVASARAVLDRLHSGAGWLRARSAERGATAVEYGLMVAFIAVAIIGAVLVFGTKVNALFIIPAGVL